MISCSCGCSTYFGCEGVKRNWQFVAYKSILSGAWYGPPLQTELWDETIEREDGQPPAQANSPFSVSTRPMCGEILPGVIVTIAHDGNILSLVARSLLWTVCYADDKYTISRI
jgi:hypothetical protein